MAVFLAGGFRAQGLASRVQAVASGLEHGGVAPLSFSDLWMPLLLVSVEGFTAEFHMGGYEVGRVLECLERCHCTSAFWRFALEGRLLLSS